MELTEKLILDTFNKKGYKFFTGKFSVNVFGIRMQTGTNLYDDLICIAYYNDDREFVINKFQATTEPGLHWLKNPMRRKGCAILVPGQYRGAYKLGPHGRKKYLAGRQCKAIPVYRDNNKDSNHDLDDSTIETGIFYTNIHHGWSSKTVNRNSAGCLVVKSKARFEKVFIPTLKESAKRYGEEFTLTLLEKEDFE